MLVGASARRMLPLELNNEFQETSRPAGETRTGIYPHILTMPCVGHLTSGILSGNFMDLMIFAAALNALA
jgi:hypothetical protein